MSRRHLQVYFIKSKLKGSLDLLNLIRLNFKLFCVTLSGSVRRITLGCLGCLSVEEYCERKWKRNIFLSPSKRLCFVCVFVCLKIQLVDQFVRFFFLNYRYLCISFTFFHYFYPSTFFYFLLSLSHQFCYCFFRLIAFSVQSDKYVIIVCFRVFLFLRIIIFQLFCVYKNISLVW